MHKSDSYTAFRRNVDILLHHLYDPAAFDRTPLARAFGVGKREDSASAVRRILLEAIEALKPDKDVPRQSNAWRYYHILFHRYVEQFTQDEVAADLGLSVRQLRRQEKPARNLLTDYLWTHFDLQRKFAEMEDFQLEALGASQEPVAASITDRQDELQWSQRFFPTESIAVKEIVDSVLKTTARLFHTLGVEVHVILPDDLPRLAVQVVPMRQALLNVLLTTTQSVPRGRIKVQAQMREQMVVIRILSMGYNQQRGTLNDEHLETLEIARKLVEFSKGAIQTFADEKQYGIEILLPREAQITVVAIDDNPDTLHLLQRYTANTRYHIIGIQDPHQALSQAADSHPQLILLDVMLPGTDGWELLGYLHRHPTLQNIPVVICTVLPQKQLAIAQGATAFIRKPIARHEFLSLLDTQFSPLH